MGPPGVTPANASAPAFAPLPQAATEQTQAVLAARLARAVRDGQTTLTVELHPIELGRVEVHLSFHPDGVGVQMTVDRRDTFDSFTRDRANLEQQLSQAGIDLGSGGLNLRFGQQSGESASRGSAVPIRSVPAAAQPLSPRSQATRTVAGLGVVDITA
ncbi:MAG TPA: flagellar hook-length control protein FliK [Rhodopila sp.]|nr:flagellar hook-length control protein FliK [Rhodopila sp.]